MFGHSVDDVFDLTFLLFHAFWALGWAVGVVLLGGLAVLFAFYSESARLENGRLVHIPKLGPLKILVDYDLAKIRNLRLEQASGNDPDTCRCASITTAARTPSATRCPGTKGSVSSISSAEQGTAFRGRQRHHRRSPQDRQSQHARERR